MPRVPLNSDVRAHPYLVCRVSSRPVFVIANACARLALCFGHQTSERLKSVNRSGKIAASYIHAALIC